MGCKGEHIIQKHTSRTAPCPSGQRPRRHGRLRLPRQRFHRIRLRRPPLRDVSGVDEVRRKKIESNYLDLSQKRRKFATKDKEQT